MVQHGSTAVASASLAPATAPSLLQGYLPPVGAYDEACAAPGVVRPHWASIVHALDALGNQELARRWEQARRLMYEHGITYNVPDGAQGLERPWQLDPVPLVLAAPEWAWLEAALIQRARLLNALLADAYGPQCLLNKGLLPPELVFAHTGFLRPCHGIRVPNRCYLYLYAVDLLRAPDGQWRVVADRTQSPAGAGYALENRLILLHTFSDVFRSMQVLRMQAFFDALHQTLCRLAPRHRDNPRIVLLTPGPAASHTYFEHVYLARFLGYTLVQGADLTVRDSGVFLKTLAGLQAVDVILRRQDDTACDPLGLPHDSPLGTAGLVQAVRAGSVVVANALGSGWLETPALLPFLPSLCRHVLGEELQLAAVPTWWCGQQEECAYVQAHLDDLDIAQALPQSTRLVEHVLRSRRTAPRRLFTALGAQPWAFVAQAPLARSTVPVWSNGGMQPGYMLLRCYLVATEEGYVVMPGGLTRVSASTKMSMPSAQWGDGSKDTWVLSASALQTPGLLPIAVQPVALRRSGYELPSRVADDLLWLGRYTERAEGAVRLLRSLLQHFTAEAGPGGTTAMPTVLQAMGERWHLPPVRLLESWQTAPHTLQQTVWQVLYDAQLPDSVCATLAALHQVATRVRDRISTDAWRVLVQLDQGRQQPQPCSVLPAGETLAWLNHTLTTLAAFSGLGMENMTRGPGWSFLDMGRRLERAMHTVALLISTLAQGVAHEGVALEAVLEIADSIMTYRARYLTTLQYAPVLDLLLSDDSNPRSVAFQLVALAEHVERLPRDIADPSLSPTQRLMLTLLTTLRLADIPALCTIDAAGQRPRLTTLLAQLTQELPALAETLTLQYLSHAELTRHLATAERLNTP